MDQAARLRRDAQLAEGPRLQLQRLRQREIGEAYRRVIGRNFPAMTLLVVAGLLEPRAKVEIEATAVLAD